MRVCHTMSCTEKVKFPFFSFSLGKVQVKLADPYLHMFVFFY